MPDLGVLKPLGVISELHFLNTGILSCFLKMSALGTGQKNPHVATSVRPQTWRMDSYTDCRNHSWKCLSSVFLMGPSGLFLCWMVNIYTR